MDRFKVALIVVLVVIAAELGFIAYQGSQQGDLVSATYAVCQQVAALRGDVLQAGGNSLGPVYQPC